MEKGTNSRTVSATNANLTSSRSHCVFTCVITRKHKKDDGAETTRVSRLNLVDLAGSERAKVSDGKDAQTLKEGCNINKSLTCLGRVIKELVDAQRKGGKAHVPYRDSKLTALLQVGSFLLGQCMTERGRCRSLWEEMPGPQSLLVSLPCLVPLENRCPLFNLSNAPSISRTKPSRTRILRWMLKRCTLKF